MGPQQHAQAAPEVRLVTRMRQAPSTQDFWSDFMFKARAAWDIFFPATSDNVMSPAGAMKSRLHVLLVSDRGGLDMPTLMQIKRSSLAALAEQGLVPSMAELEVQVSSMKANGERVQLTLPLDAIPERRTLRDAADYDYQSFDDDDYFTDDFLDMPDEVEVRPG